MDFETLVTSLNFSNIIWQIVTPLVFMLGDIITGIIQAVINKNLDSQIMREGILRKLLLVLVIILSFIFSYSFNLNFIAIVVCIYIILMEIISIGENLKKAGVDLGKLGELLKKKGE